MHDILRNLPTGARVLDLDFQFVSPVETKEGRVVMTPEMLNLQWNAVLLYPAEYFSREFNTSCAERRRKSLLLRYRL